VEGLNRLDVLHEVTHLTCDLMAPKAFLHRWAPGHRRVFVENFGRLLETWVSPRAAAAWKTHWEKRVLAGHIYKVEELLELQAEGERHLRQRNPPDITR